MKRTAFSILSIALFLYGCNQTHKEGNKNQDTTSVKDTIVQMQDEVSLQLKWKTDTTLTTCESVLYDKDRQILYVSNIDGVPDQKDQNGFISKVSPEDGKIENLKWVTGLNAPKGMGISNGKLYVADINALVEINIANGTILKKYEVPGARFLNDITIGADSTVYFSDSYTGKIHSFKNGKIEMWKEGFPQANGLLAMDGKLYLASMDSTFKVIDETTKKDSLLVKGVGAGDGVVNTGSDGEFIVSNWYGEIYFIRNGKLSKILDTKEQKLYSADIEYIVDKNLLLVPTFFGNQVHAYELKK